MKIGEMKPLYAVFFVFVAGVIWSIFFYSEPTPVHISRRTQCLSNLKDIALAALIYSTENDDSYPLISDWSETTRPYHLTAETFSCPEVSALKGKYGYAYNSLLTGTSVDRSDADRTPMFYDSVSLARDTADPVTSLPAKGRHGGKNIIAYVDGHAKAVTP